MTIAPGASAAVDRLWVPGALSFGSWAELLAIAFDLDGHRYPSKIGALLSLATRRDPSLLAPPVPHHLPNRARIKCLALLADFACGTGGSGSPLIRDRQKWFGHLSYFTPRRAGVLWAIIHSCKPRMVRSYSSPANDAA
jgi:hypothetical protein